jgi:hypothetical protein
MSSEDITTYKLVMIMLWRFSERSIVLFTLKELVLLLEKEISFEPLLKSKVEAIQLEGRLMYD